MPVMILFFMILSKFLNFHGVFPMKQQLSLGIWLSSLLVLAGSAPAAEPTAIHAANKQLGRGINLGNALEAPKEGAWGVTLRPEYFQAIRQAGFATVRLPVKWSAHSQTSAPYTIDAK